MFFSSPLNRRQILAAGSLALGGLTLPTFWQRRSLAVEQSLAASDLGKFGQAKSCIMLFMWGGPAHQDTWDLKPDAPAEVRGEFAPIATNVPGIDICEHFPLLATRCDQLAIIRSMTHTDVNHTTGTAYLLTGQPPSPAGSFDQDWPALGSVISSLGRGRDPLPPFVSMRPELPGDVPRFVEESHGQFGGWLGSRYNPLTIDADPSQPDYRVGDFVLQDGVSVNRLDRRHSLLSGLQNQNEFLLREQSVETMSSHYRRAFELLHSSAGQSAFDLAAEPPEVRQRYGLNPHGQSVLQARRLVEAGVPLVTIFWPNDGIKNVSVYWDTHSKNFIDLKTRLMPVADQAFSALLDDLQERGLLDETLVIWTGEFGRTPKIGQRNSDAGAGRDGRDHWPNCFTSVLAGGGVVGGQVYGASDRHAAFPAVNPVHPVDLMATVHHLLGIPPQLSMQDTLGRPHVICPGSPIIDLL